MRLAVFGATGGTGRQLVAQALAAGHDVTVLARRPDTVRIRDERLRVIKGDVLQPGSAALPVAGADAVVSALGVGYRRDATVVYSQGVSNIIGAMRAEGVRRLVCVSSTALESAPGTPLPLRALHKLVLQRMLRRPFADLSEMERLVADSGLDWTIVRAARLTNGHRRGGYHTAAGRSAGRGLSISRADLAGYMLACLHDRSAHSHKVEIAY